MPATRPWTNGLVIDLSALDGIAVDRSRRSARPWARERCSSTFTLGWPRQAGPFRRLVSDGRRGRARPRWWGRLRLPQAGHDCGQRLALTIVTADGRVLTCDRSRNADLYWACRGGGGGNFGVVTGFRFRIHPVNRASYFVLTWPWASVDDAVAAWQRFAPRAPDGLFSVCRLATGSSQPTVQAFGQFFGSEAALVALLKPLRDVPGASLTTGTSSYMDLMKRWAGCKTITLDECHLSPAGDPRSRHASPPSRTMLRSAYRRPAWRSCGDGSRSGRDAEAGRRSSTRTAERSTA